MGKKILAVLLILVAAILVTAAMQPSDFRVTRSISITAEPAAVFPQVNDMQKWLAWSPWEKLDPQMKRTFEGPQSGVGASYSWAGNSDVGSGTSTITESVPNQLVKFKLEMKEPFAGTNDVEFMFKPEGTQTVVSWGMFGKKNFIAKVIGLFFDCEKMVGAQFEQGLAQLKTVVESGAL